MSLWEIVVVLVVAMLALGPRRLPEIAKVAGRALRDFRRAANELRTTLDTAIDEAPVTPVTPVHDAKDPIANPNPNSKPSFTLAPAADAEALPDVVAQVSSHIDQVPAISADDNAPSPARSF